MPVVVLAEKPSVARDIAAVLGARNRHDGYFDGNGYAITYAFGHLVTIAEPEQMNPSWGSPWRLEQLPMLPQQWKYRVVEKASTQFKVIKKLFCDSQTTAIICATDAGREGEHIFRLIYKLSGCKKPAHRLWISSLTAEAIKDGFKKLKPARDFDNLARAAAARAHADWIVGLNFTRAYTTMNRQLSHKLCDLALEGSHRQLAFCKKLTDGQIEALVLHGQTKVIKGFKKKDGSGKYDARLVLNEEFKVRLSFEK
ncbi:MAG: toprim domain-containing protein [Terriglobales bacterium]